MNDLNIYNNEPLITNLRSSRRQQEQQQCYPEQYEQQSIPGDNLINRIRQLIFLVFIYSINSIKLAYVIWFNSIWYLISFIYQREKSVYNKIVLITGSGGYLGRHLAVEFAKRNALLVLWDINEVENNKTNELLKSTGYRRARLFTVDLTNEDQIRATSNKVKEQIGDVSMIVMAAAPSFNPKSIMDTNYNEDLAKHFKISYLSQLWLIQEFLKPMINKACGHIVTISSSTALVDIPLVSSYASFKLAQTKLIESLREELAYNQITDVKTTIVYLAVLEGGIAEGFKDVFDMPKSLTLSGKYAAEKIVSGILKDHCLIFLPASQRYFSIVKDLISPRLLSFFVSYKLKISPKFMKLKNSLF